MELLQLRYFCDAAETENFSRTAQKHQVPPSDVSQSIKRLETELSVKLFDRTANRIVLNARGKAFYQKVKQALLLLEDAGAEATDREDAGELRLSIRTNRRIVMQTVRNFRQLHPDVDVLTTHQLHSDPGDFHLMIGDETLAESGFRRRKLLSEDVYLAMSRSNPISAGEGIDAEALSAEPFISLGPGNSLHDITLEACRKWGFEPHIAIQSEDPFYIRKCVELNLGVAVIPAVSWKGQISDSICLRKIDGFQRNTYVYWDEKKCVPACAKMFLEMLEQAFRTEADE